ncbi:MAG: flippase [Bacteriovoracaceae bacterium]
MLKFIRESRTFTAYFHNTGWIFAEKVLRLFFSFAVGIYVARYLGPNDFGVLSFVLSLVMIGLPVSNLGLDTVLVKEFVKKERSHQEIIGTGLFLRFAATVLVNVILFAIYKSHLYQGEIEQNLLFVLIAANFFQVSNVFDFYFQSQVKAKFTSIAIASSVFISSLFRLYGILTQKDLMFFGYSFIVEFGVLGLILLYFALKLDVFKTALRLNKGYMKSLLKECWPLILSGALISIYMKIDQVMLKSLLDTRSVGNYSAAVKISEFWYVIPMTIGTSLFPLMTKNYHENLDLYMHRLKVIMGICFWSFLILAIGLHLFSELIISLLFGNDYTMAHEALRIHGYAGIITSMSIFFSQKFILDQKTKIYFVGTLFGAIANVGLNLWLIPLSGISGAAWATVISYGIPTIVVSILYDKEIGLTYIRSVFYLLKAKRFKS